MPKYKLSNPYKVVIALVCLGIVVSAFVIIKRMEPKSGLKPDETIEKTSDHTANTTQKTTEAPPAALPTLDKYTYVGTFDNGKDIYTEAYRYGLQDAAWKMFLVEDGTIIKTFEGTPSKPKFTKDRKQVFYIDNLQFEAVGNVALYDVQTDAIEMLTDLDDQGTSDGRLETVKDVEAYGDEGHLLCIVGSAVGTVTQGGEIYDLDPTTKILEKIDLTDLAAQWTKHPYEVVDIAISDQSVQLTLVEWTDENYNEYYYSVHSLNFEELGVLKKNNQFRQRALDALKDTKADLIDLNESEMAKFKAFQASKNDKDLMGLEPLSLCKFYLYAELIRDQETAYALYTTKKDQVLFSKDEFLQAPPNERLNDFESYLDIQDLKVAYMDASQQDAVVTWKTSDNPYIHGFKLTKDDDVWKVSYLPIQ